MKNTTVEPSRQQPLIGPRLRDARLRQGLSIDDVARSTALTKGFISRVERDLTSPSVSTLVALCETLSIPVGELFETPKLGLVRAEDAPEVKLTGTGVHERLLTTRAQGRLQLVRSTIEPGGTGGPDLYTLNCDLEVVHVLSGKLVMRFSDGEEKLSPGDTMSFSGREPHSWQNPGKRPTEVIWVIVPAPWSTGGE